MGEMLSKKVLKSINYLKIKTEENIVFNLFLICCGIIIVMIVVKTMLKI
jgi:hypothetical protein